MAEQSEEERTEEPTPKRLQDAREKGQIPRSRELNSVVLLLAGALAISGMGSGSLEHLTKLMRAGFALERRDAFDLVSIYQRLWLCFTEAAWAVLPILAVLAVAALLAPVALGGWLMSSDAVLPKWERINPVSGLTRILSPHGLIEMLKAIAKCALLGLVTYWLFKRDMAEFAQLSREPLAAALPHVFELLVFALIVLSASLAGIAALDVPFQLWNHHRKLRMTLQEIKDEMKETEGKPEVKGRIRRLQMEAAQRRMMDQVPKADVVVTNPTHFAVALRYEQGTMGAPRVVARGVDQVALRIREVAGASGVPLLAAPPLARAIYYSTKLDSEIPGGLYFAVAQVLAYVYQLKAARTLGGAVPTPPSVDIPPEFRKE